MMILIDKDKAILTPTVPAKSVVALAIEASPKN
jgi:hypothetical protein